MQKVTNELPETPFSPLQLQGTIPHWLSGTLVRNGPVSVSVDGKHPPHWFDGLAMLHAFTFEQGRVCYANRFLRTEAYKTVFEKGSLNYPGFAQDPCHSLFKRFFTWLAPTSTPKLPNANVSVAQIAQAYVALTETPLPVRFDLKTLQTLGVLDYQDPLPKERCWESAHPHRIQNGTLNYLTQYGGTSHYILYVVPDTTCKRKILAKIPVKEPSYMHSFAMTENYVIFTEFPFVIAPLDLLTKGKAFIHNFTWKPERGTCFTVISRLDGSLVGRYMTQPFFAFHHANAFESNGMLHVDLITYPDPSIIETIADYGQNPSREHEKINTRLERFSWHIDSQRIAKETLFEGSVEFPRINESYHGIAYRYLYTTDIRDQVDPREDIRPLYKLDTQTKQLYTWSEKGCYPGEAIFVPTPGAIEEDAGVILSIVHKPAHKASFLLLLDAATFQELGRAIAPHPIPPGLHGHFFND